jgi:putative ATP-binding cassette transporter
MTAFWALAKPYWVSDRRGKGLLLLAVVVGLALGSVWISVQITNWYNDFYNVIQEKRQADFYPQLGRFALLAFGGIIVAVYRLYFLQMLQIEWRTWLTERYMGDWLADRTYYRLQLLDQGTDNPDQRISEDLRLFVENTLALGLGLLSSVVTLLSFIVLLWTLSGTVEILGISIPGYMVWFAVVYAVVGTWLTHLIGKPLIGLNFGQQRFEADFRYSLVRLRENSEGVALYRGEREELGTFHERFAHVISNWWGIMKKQKHLNWFTSFYAQFSIIFPFLVAAPRYFSGAITLGGLMQISSAFDKVQGSLSWFIDAYPRFAEWKATVDRLTGFSASIADAREAARVLAGDRMEGEPGLLSLDGLEVSLPDGKPLLQHASAQIKAHESVLLTGASGSGKSTLFRALAGIWPYWKGRIRLPKGARLLFLPQKPYLPIGSLKHAVAYPDDASRFTDAEVKESLKAAGLTRFGDDLERTENWSQVLSGGEQQRVAFARALLNKPDWLFLDEATAALPEPDQESLYRLLKERLPGTTVISIGHRESLAELHPGRLAVRDGSLAAA